MKIKRIYYLLLPALLIGFIAILMGSIHIRKISHRNNIKPIRIGYFHGGRTALMFRAYENYQFEKKGLVVKFYTKDLRDKKYYIVPKSITKFNMGGQDVVGKAKGTELIDEILDGKFDLAMVGESSFISSIYAGKPIVAIAELGHDVKGQSGHVFLMRKGLKVNKPEDYLGKVLVSRRAGPGDLIFLKEYLEHEGINLREDALQLDKLPLSLKEKEKLPKNKIVIVGDLYEDEMERGIRNGVIDGGYFHLMLFEKLLNSFELIQPLEYWANPELSHALLVCNERFLRENRDFLIKLLEVYIERIKYEHSLTFAERVRKQQKGKQMAADIQGCNYPQYDIIPIVNIDLLNEVIRLLKKYNFIGENKIKIDKFVDNSLVLEAIENLGIKWKE